MSYIYACLFSNGYIKVGRSDNPDNRIRQHTDRVSCFGITLISSNVRGSSDSFYAERLLIEKCASEAAIQQKREWFYGLDYTVVLDWIDEFAIQNSSYETKVNVVSTIQEVGISDHIPRYIITWPNGIKIGSHIWADTQPDIPHWPDSSVMRWDLRQDDWHKIWPELIDHPCAIYFAPRHPLRIGDRSFTDWVKSWPSSFNDADYLETMPDSAKQIVFEVWEKFKQ